MKVSREKLLSQLEAAEAGVARKEVVEQSNCFVFRDGKVWTFNEEVACVGPTALDDIEAAVNAEKLLGALRKLKEDTLDIQLKGAELVLIGEGRRTRITVEQQIALPIEAIEPPSEWRPLATGFAEAIATAHNCTSGDGSMFHLTCVHATPDYIEACDNFQLVRCKVAQPLDGEWLLRGASIKNVVDLGMTEFCDTDHWVHFRNPNQLTFSCRRHVEKYPDLTPLLKKQGEPAVLPTGLAEAVELCVLFAKDTAGHVLIEVHLKPGRLRVVGRSVGGQHEEIKSIEYAGPPIKFRAAPRIIADLSKWGNRCLISDSKLMIKGGAYLYVSGLAPAEE